MLYAGFGVFLNVAVLFMFRLFFLGVRRCSYIFYSIVYQYLL